ncbi:MAG: thioredoxin family protein [Bacteriovoracaceae bacterium]|nr:thioredoxin family protein [Bacteriovoracaceae bacterium]
MVEELKPEELDRVAAMEVGAYIINFYSKSCAPCNTMKPVLESFSAHNPGTRVYRIDASKSPELSQTFGVRGVPATFFCEGREVIHSTTGVTSEFELQRVISAWDNPTFRETGELPPVTKKTDFLFVGVIAIVAVIFIGALLLI